MIALAIIGGACSLVGVVWIAVIAFQNDDVLMGVLSLICGIVTLIYGIQHIEQAKVPLILLAVGFVLSVVGRVALLSS